MLRCFNALIPVQNLVRPGHGIADTDAFQQPSVSGRPDHHVSGLVASPRPSGVPFDAPAMTPVVRSALRPMAVPAAEVVEVHGKQTGDGELLVTPCSGTPEPKTYTNSSVKSTGWMVISESRSGSWRYGSGCGQGRHGEHVAQAMGTQELAAERLGGMAGNGHLAAASRSMSCPAGPGGGLYQTARPAYGLAGQGEEHLVERGLAHFDVIDGEAGFVEGAHDGGCQAGLALRTHAIVNKSSLTAIGPTTEEQRRQRGRGSQTSEIASGLPQAGAAGLGF